jgi:hypothetical protein
MSGVARCCSFRTREGQALPPFQNTYRTGRCRLSPGHGPTDMPRRATKVISSVKAKSNLDTSTVQTNKKHHHDVESNAGSAAGSTSQDYKKEEAGLPTSRKVQRRQVCQTIDEIRQSIVDQRRVGVGS